MLTYMNAKGYAVMAVIFAELRDKVNLIRSHEIEPYLNGREAGFKITHGKRQVVFCEARRSDSIQVYASDDNLAFSMQGNTPSEDVYFNHSKQFEPNDYAGAADYVIGYLGLNVSEENFYKPV